MEVYPFRQVWGFDLFTTSPSEAIALVAHQGYAGIEASLGDLFGRADYLSLPVKEQEERCSFWRHLLSSHHLKLIVGLYTTWTDYEPEHGAAPSSVTQHLSNYELQLLLAQKLEPFHVNVHSGEDSWDWSQQEEFLRGALDLEHRIFEGSRRVVSHETHRGRLLFSPWAALKAVRAFPDLRLTLDFSHWVMVCERLFINSSSSSLLTSCASESKELLSDATSVWAEEWLNEIAERVDHIHTRLGDPQNPQLPLAEDLKNLKEKGGPLSVPEEVLKSKASVCFHRVWSLVWQQRKKEGVQYFSFTPEYGPFPYARLVLTSGELGELILSEKNRLKTFFR